MASQGEQGTGKHPHKKASEPYPHTRADGSERAEGKPARGGAAKAESKSYQDDGGSRARGGGTKAESRSTGAQAQNRQQTQAQGRQSDSADLKQREYRGDDGQIHHHTRTYMQQDRNEK